MFHVKHKTSLHHLRINDKLATKVMIYGEMVILNNNQKLIAIDIDGTLINSEHQMMPVTKKQIQRAIAGGHHVVLCSGRSIRGLKGYLKELGIWGKQDQYAVTFNGGNVFDLGTLKSVAACYLTTEQVIEADQLAAQLGIQKTIVTSSLNSYSVNAPMSVEAMHDVRDSQLKPIRTNNYDFLKDENVQKCMWTDRPEMIEAKEPLIPQDYYEKYQIVRSGPIFLEFLPKNSSKGNAIQKLAKQLGINLQNVIAFGDEENDLSMFSIAGTAVAMANARDTIKKYADCISVADHDHDGVGKTLKVLL